jgi:hypothetical protein
MKKYGVEDIFNGMTSLEFHENLPVGSKVPFEKELLQCYSVSSISSQQKTSSLREPVFRHITVDI